MIIYGTQIILIVCYLTLMFSLLKFPLEANSSFVPKKAIFLLGVLLIILAITRPEETADTDNYTYSFSRGVFTGRMEPMFAFIVWFSRCFSYPVIVGFFIYALLSIWPRLYFINKYSTNIYASIMVYLSFCYIAQDIVAIRSGVASAILLIAIDFKLKEKYKKMAIAICIACLFHYTSLVFFLLFLVDIKKRQRIIYLSILSVSYFLYYIDFDIRVIFPYLQYLTFLDYNVSTYAVSTETVFGTLNGPQILRITTCVFCWIFVDRITLKNKYALTFLKIYTISICMYPIFSSINIMGSRLYEIFASAEAIMIPICFIGVFQKSLLSKLAIIVYSTYFFYISITSIAYWAPI